MHTSQGGDSNLGSPKYGVVHCDVRWENLHCAYLTRVIIGDRTSVPLFRKLFTAFIRCFRGMYICPEMSEMTCKSVSSCFSLYDECGRNYVCSYTFLRLISTVTSYHTHWSLSHGCHGQSRHWLVRRALGAVWWYGWPPDIPSGLVKTLNVANTKRAWPSRLTQGLPWAVHCCWVNQDISFVNNRIISVINEH
jgi:hypothetical protein